MTGCGRCFSPCCLSAFPTVEATKQWFYTLVYRVSDLLPLCTLIVMTTSELQRVWRGAVVLLGFLVVCLGLGNGGAELYPKSFEGNNARLQQMLFIKAHTESQGWVAVGAIDDLYLPYFVPCKMWEIMNTRESHSSVNEPMMPRNS